MKCQESEDGLLLAASPLPCLMPTFVARLRSGSQTAIVAIGHPRQSHPGFLAQALQEPIFQHMVLSANVWGWQRLPFYVAPLTADRCSCSIMEHRPSETSSSFRGGISPPNADGAGPGRRRATLFSRRANRFRRSGAGARFLRFRRLGRLGQFRRFGSAGFRGRKFDRGRRLR